MTKKQSLTYGLPKSYVEKHARPGETYKSAAKRLRAKYESEQNDKEQKHRDEWRSNY